MSYFGNNHPGFVELECDTHGKFLIPSNGNLKCPECSRLTRLANQPTGVTMPTPDPDDNKYFFNGIRDLSKVGMICLTGEACAIGMRLLFDVTEEGRKIVCKTLGLPLDTKLAESWNNGSVDNPHVGSIFLTFDMWQAFAITACFQRGNVHCVFKTRDMVFVVTKTEYAERGGEEWIQKLRECHESSRVYSLPNVGGQPHNGMSSVHAMSGRSQ